MPPKEGPNFVECTAIIARKLEVESLPTTTVSNPLTLMCLILSMFLSRLSQSF